MPEIKKFHDNRREFIDVLIELAERDKAVTLSIPDVGFLYVEEFSKRFPDRFFNNGCTELFTIADAAGQAIGGLKPHCYSMRNFVLFRPFEGVRNCIVHHKANVKLLGVKGSTSYRFLGFSHNLTHEEEDVNVCDIIGLDFAKPKNTEQVRAVMEESYQSEKPIYIAL